MPIADIGQVLADVPLVLYTALLFLLPVVLVALWMRDARRDRGRD